MSLKCGRLGSSYTNGRILLQKAIDSCLNLNIKTILGFVFGHNKPSLGLFRSFAFQDWGAFPNIAELDGIERDLIIVGKRIQEVNIR